MKERAQVAALMIGPLNCEAALGVPWRWVREKAKELGVPIYGVERKSVIPAAELLEAFKRHGVRHPAEEVPPEPGTPEEEAWMARKLGLRIKKDWET